MSYRTVRPDGLELRTSRAGRSPSLSSDIQSVSGRSVAPAAPAVNPPPAYIASAGASQLVSTEVGNSVSVSQPALVLLNNFLDQILFNLLSSAHSVHLSQLKATLPIVLKPRLGKAALQAADEELREYLEESDDEELHATTAVFEPKSDFDVEHAWKLARLRCMVYTRLGDLEEEDEEEYIEQEQLHDRDRGFGRPVHLGPASAIFLTSVLEYLGEQALYYAVQHAQKRSQAGKTQEQSLNQEADPAGAPDLVLEEVDLFQVGRESPLSRLWRSWRRNMRTPREPVSRPLSPETPAAPTTHASPTEAPGFNSRKNSIGSHMANIDEEHQSLGQVLQSKSPSQIPIPMSDRDVDEIEVPGLAKSIEDDDNRREPIAVPERSNRRPTSMYIVPGGFPAPTSPMSPDRPVQAEEKGSQRPKPRHTRSSSVPTPAQNAFTTTQDTERQETQPDGVEEDNDADQAAVVDTTPELESRPVTAGTDGKQSLLVDREHEQEQLGKVAAAVSAVAGALGIGAIASSPGGKDEDLQHQSRQEDARRTKTVAEEFLGPSSAVAAPKDAVTGASITSVGDFGSIHVPVERAPPEKESVPPAELEGSDPEDLALSSADEESPGSLKEGLVESRGQHTSANQNFADRGHSATSTGTSFYHDADEPEESLSKETTMAPTSANASPNQMSKRTNREAKIFPQPSAQGVTAYVESAAHDRPLWTNAPVEKTTAAGQQSTYQSVTVPTVLSRPITEVQTIQSPRSTMDGQEVFVDTYSRPGTAGSAAFPVRISSSSNRAATGRLHANSTTSQHSHHSSSSSKLLGFDREEANRSEQSNRGVDTAATAVNGVRGARSGGTGVAKDVQIASAGSPNSIKRHLRLRAGSEEARKGTSPVDSIDESKKKSLEVLINSDETLHYTLTPASARAENFPTLPKQTTQTQDLADFFRNTKPPAEDGPRTAKSAGLPGSDGLRSNPAQSDSTAPSTAVDKFIPLSKKIVPSGPSSPKMRNMLGGPRDPRVDQNSTRDLADYARSTGPESTGQLPKALASPKAPSTAAGIAAAAAYSRSTASTSHSDRPPGTAASSSSKSTASRLKYQARDARPARTAETSDLIDFIREGPPRAAGDHRIDRNVAPFRRTMDSDDLNDLAPERDRNGTSSVASTQNSSVATRSMQESMNSRTGLLDSTNRSNARQVNGNRAGPAATLRQTALVEEGGMPKRTRRRVRDPYAIDDSDDELEEEAVTPKPKTQDESLIDFLRNTAPNKLSTAQPIMTASSSSIGTSSTVRKEQSSSTLKDRLQRKLSLNQGSRNGDSAKPTAAAASAESTPGYIRATNGAREESPHLSQMGSKYDKYRPTQPTHAAHMERPRQKPSADFQARDPRSGGDTRDLAAYLKDSGPPTPPASQQARSIPIKEEAGFLKFFSRRRASFRK